MCEYIIGWIAVLFAMLELSLLTPQNEFSKFGK
jgi:hypothetical protein